MLRDLKAVVAGVVVCLFLPAGLSAQMSFKKVEARTAYGRAEEGKKGKLIIRWGLYQVCERQERTR